MPVFEENPDQFSKSRLKTELIAHNITLPSTESKKEVYLELYLKHISHKSVADFSSDEEDDLARDVAEEKTQGSDMFDLIGLTDDDLKAALLKHGVKTGPIVATTRAIYERKLKKILLPSSQPDLNGRGDAGQYSDSDEGEEKAEEDSFDSEHAEPETALKLDQDQQEISQGPVVDVLKMMFPNTVTPPTGISATCRMPIKGAAERPIKFKYPDIPKTPVSPATLESRWVERRLVPLWVQILVFLIIACLLYLIYASMEACSDSPFLSVIEKLSVESEGEEGLPFQPEPQDTPMLGSPSD